MHTVFVRLSIFPLMAVVLFWALHARADSFNGNWTRARVSLIDEGLRTAEVFSPEDAKKVLGEVLQNVLDKPDVKVDLINAEESGAFNAGKPQKMKVTRLDYHTESQRFSAYMLLDGGKHYVLQGRFTEMVRIPVLKARMQQGDVIKAEDINIAEVDHAFLREGAVLKADDLVGRTPKRFQVAGKPVQYEDLMEPNLVAKDATVTMHYKTALMQLRTLGVALEDGHRGDIIRVKNPTSKRIVQATITGPDTVEVAPLAGGLAMAQ